MSVERLKGNVIRYDSRTLIVSELHSRKHYLCDMPGRFKKLGIRPIVGDVVEFVPTGDGTGKVENILNRRNELKRPRIANVDQIVLVTCLEEPAVSFYILDRFLILAEYSTLPTIIAVNKVDLLSSRKALLELYHTYGEYYSIIEVSAKTGYNMDLLREVFRGKISTMAGMSGVGKSSLLNALKPGLKLRTSDISKRLDRGKHTTTTVELLEFDFGGYVADTPGFASLELPEILPEELKDYFRELKVHGGYCAFSDCAHIDEPGCYIKELVETGDIPSTRYESYKKMYEELQEKNKGKKRWK